MPVAAALSGTAAGQAKGPDGSIECIRVLRVARRGARLDRVRAINQLRDVIATSPGQLREQLRSLPRPRLIATCANLRPAADLDVLAATKHALRELARRIQFADEELARLDALLEPLVAETAPDLVALHGVGTDTAGPSSSPPATSPTGSATNEPSRNSAAPHRSQRHQAASFATA